MGVEDFLHETPHAIFLILATMQQELRSHGRSRRIGRGIVKPHFRMSFFA